MHFVLLSTLSHIWDFVLYSSRAKKAEVVTITTGDVLTFVSWIVLLYLLILVMGRRLLRKAFKRLTSNPVDASSFANFSTTILFIIGVLILISSTGINLTALSVFGGLLGVGIGFGLQNIANNLVSGLIIFLEKPIKRGDRIQMDEIEGNIKRISFRSTTVKTNDNFSVIIPNSYFLQNKIINWSHSDRRVRLSLPIGIGYNEDLEKVKRIMLGVAGENKQVLKNPAPDVVFENVGDSALNFSLRVWTETFLSNPRDLKSEIYFALYARLRDSQVEMAYPQLDIWFRDKWVEDFFRRQKADPAAPGKSDPA